MPPADVRAARLWPNRSAPPRCIARCWRCASAAGLGSARRHLIRIPTNTITRAQNPHPLPNSDHSPGHHRERQQQVGHAPPPPPPPPSWHARPTSRKATAAVAVPTLPASRAEPFWPAAARTGRCDQEARAPAPSPSAAVLALASLGFALERARMLAVLRALRLHVWWGAEGSGAGLRVARNERGCGGLLLLLLLLLRVPGVRQRRHAPGMPGGAATVACPPAALLDLLVQRHAAQVLQRMWEGQREGGTGERGGRRPWWLR